MVESNQAFPAPSTAAVRVAATDDVFSEYGKR